MVYRPDINYLCRIKSTELAPELTRLFLRAQLIWSFVSAASLLCYNYLLSRSLLQPESSSAPTQPLITSVALLHHEKCIIADVALWIWFRCLVLEHFIVQKEYVI